MSGILPAKGGNIDGKNVSGLATITPCVGGLIVWYTQYNVAPLEADEKKDSAETGAEKHALHQ